MTSQRRSAPTAEGSTGVLAGVTLASSALVFAVVFSGLLVGPELWLFDHALARRAGTAPSPYVAVIGITEDDLARFGHPIDDATLAHAIEMIAEAAPAGIGIDLYRDRPVGDGLDRLAAAARAHPYSVFVMRLPDDVHPGVAPPRFLDADAQVGFADVVLDDDGVIRRGLLYLWDDQGAAHVSLGLRLAAKRLAAAGRSVGPGSEEEGSVRVGATRLPPLGAGEGGYVRVDARGYQFLLDYAFAGVASHSLSDLLDGRVPVESLRDRVVLLGIVAESAGDLFATPLRALRPGVLDPGVELHARAVDQLVRLGLDEARPIRGASPLVEALAVLTVAAAGALAGSRVRSLLALAVTLIVGAGLVVSFAVLALRAGTWLPTLSPLVAGSLALGLAVTAGARRERRERAQLMRLFGSYVSPTVADLLWSRRADLIEGGRLRPERRTVTVLMADLVGFSRAADALSPERLLQWLDLCMTALAERAAAHGGIVDDYFGDGLKADFGLPRAIAKEPDVAGDAKRAVRCAITMAEAIRVLAERFEREGLPPVRLRVGIATGEAVVGTLGSSERLKYTAIGTVANIAARLESLEREDFAGDTHAGFARVLVAESTRRLLDDEFEVEDLGAQPLKGLSEPEGVSRVRVGGSGNRRVS